MPESTSRLDPDERLRSLNPVPGPPSDAEIDAALRRVLTRVPTAEASSRRSWPQTASRRRIALGSSVAATAATAAFVVVNVLPASRTPGAVSYAWAKRVIAHAAATVAGSGSGILHIVETTTSTNYTDTIQSWDSQTTPHRVWETNQEGSDNTKGPDTSILTRSGDTLETYDAANNTLHEVHRVPPGRAAGLEADGNPAYKDALELTEEENVSPAATSTTVPAGGSSSFQVPTFSDLIVAPLKAPGITVNPSASVNGESAISITGKPGPSTRYTLYVQPQTYTPLQLVETGPANGSDTAQSTITTTFNTYETLPAGSVSMPNLAQLYPDAKIVSTLIAIDRWPATER